MRLSEKIFTYISGGLSTVCGFIGGFLLGPLFKEIARFLFSVVDHVLWKPSSGGWGFWKIMHSALFSVPLKNNVGSYAQHYGAWVGGLIGGLIALKWSARLKPLIKRGCDYVGIDIEVVRGQLIQGPGSSPATVSAPTMPTLSKESAASKQSPPPPGKSEAGERLSRQNTVPLLHLPKGKSPDPIPLKQSSEPALNAVPISAMSTREASSAALSPSMKSGSFTSGDRGRKGSVPVPVLKGGERSAVVAGLDLPGTPVPKSLLLQKMVGVRNESPRASLTGTPPGTPKNGTESPKGRNGL